MNPHFDYIVVYTNVAVMNLLRKLPAKNLILYKKKNYCDIKKIRFNLKI